jgi:hypothetical protein
VHKKFGQKVEEEFDSERRGFPPLNPLLCKDKENNEIKELL